MNRDNQQGRVSEADLGWLGGIIDGEGTLSISRSLSHRKTVVLFPRVSIPNTSSKIISKVAEVFEKIGIKIGHKEERPFRRPQWKQATVLSVGSLAEIAKFLRVITPYVHGKREHCEVLLAYCELRLTSTRRRNQKIVFTDKGKIASSSRSDMYGETEWNLYNRLKELNHKGTSKYNPQRLNVDPPSFEGVKLQSEPSGDVGKSAEMADSFSEKIGEE